MLLTDIKNLSYHEVQKEWDSNFLGLLDRIQNQFAEVWPEDDFDFMDVMSENEALAFICELMCAFDMTGEMKTSNKKIVIEKSM